MKISDLTLKPFEIFETEYPQQFYELFSENDSTILDFYLQNEFSEKILLKTFVENWNKSNNKTDLIKGYLQIYLLKYYDYLLNIKSNIENVINENPLTPYNENVTYTETKESSGNQTTQNSSNAFDSEIESNTDKTDIIDSDNYTKTYTKNLSHSINKTSSEIAIEKDMYISKNSLIKITVEKFVDLIALMIV